jgi:hypothetical protein
MPDDEYPIDFASEATAGQKAVDAIMKLPEHRRHAVAQHVLASIPPWTPPLPPTEPPTYPDGSPAGPGTAPPGSVIIPEDELKRLRAIEDEHASSKG